MYNIIFKFEWNNNHFGQNCLSNICPRRQFIPGTSSLITSPALFFLFYNYHDILGKFCAIETANDSCFVVLLFSNFAKIYYNRIVYNHTIWFWYCDLVNVVPFEIIITSDGSSHSLQLWWYSKHCAAMEMARRSQSYHESELDRLCIEL